MSSSQNPSSFEKKVLAMLQGFRAAFPASPQEVIFGGKTMTLAQVHAGREEIADRLAAVHRAQHAHRRAVRAREAANAASKAFYEDGVLFARHHFGRDSKRMAAFGVPPRKVRRVLTSQEKAIAKAKAAATRTLRGTLGRRQRAAITTTAQPTLQVFGADGRLLPGQPGAPDPAATCTPSEGKEPGRSAASGPAAPDTPPKSKEPGPSGAE